MGWKDIIALILKIASEVLPLIPSGAMVMQPEEQKQIDTLHKQLKDIHNAVKSFRATIAES